MNIEAFLLCDAATDQQGKMNVLGAFDNIYAKQVPAKHPACAVAARIRFERIEQGEHSIRIDIIDFDGRSIGPKLDGKLNVQVADNVDSNVVNIILNIQGLELKNFGQYRIDLAIDGRIEATLPLRIVKIPDSA